MQRRPSRNYVLMISAVTTSKTSGNFLWDHMSWHLTRRFDRLWGPLRLLSNGYTACFPGSKARPGRDVNHSPLLVPRSWMSRSYTSCPP
jgi:hypothetical protein